MLVRQIQSSDAEDYLSLRKASELEFPQYVGASVEHELSVGESGIRDLLASYHSNGIYVFGVFDGEKLAGVSCLTRKDSNKYRHKAFLWGMYIYPEYRNSGVSSMLMEHAIDWCRSQGGIMAIQLFVTTTNAAGIKLYKRYHFASYGTERNHMFSAGSFHDAELMELPL